MRGVSGRERLLSRRERVLRRDHFRCVYCGGAFAAADLTLDHVEPRMRGGDDSEGNLVACCRDCNRLKGGLAAWSFLERRPDLRSNFMAAAESSDTRYAVRVWDRLLRAIEEAARHAAS
jgi:hypothetical protein